MKNKALNDSHNISAENALKIITRVNNEVWVTKDDGITRELMLTLNNIKKFGMPSNGLVDVIDSLIVVLSVIPINDFINAMAFINSELESLRTYITLRSANQSAINDDSENASNNARIVTARLDAMVNSAIFAEIVSLKINKIELEQ